VADDTGSNAINNREFNNMPLHVVFDARHWRDFGIGTYARNLIQALAWLDHDNRYTLIARPEDREEMTGLPANFEVSVYGRPDTTVLHNLTFPLFVKHFNADLCHIPLNFVPFFMPRPYVVTIHDMSSLKFPARNELRETAHEERYKRGAQRAARIIAVSQATRRDLETVLHADPERIRTIYSAPDPAFLVNGHDNSGDNEILERYSIKRPFVLYAGTIRPHKNVSRLIDAFAVVRAELERHPDFGDLRLVIIGDELSKYPEVRRAVLATRIAPYVRFLGFVPIQTLKVFYRAASVFAFPSLYEGFGLAPLEAMACGTPVIASSLPSLVEAVGDAAELVSPDNVFDIARGLRDTLLNPERRAELTALGHEQARRFDWKQTGRAVLDIYYEIKQKKIK
jgi:glycosyltransferase involved in cell wall biosynthesis